MRVQSLPYLHGLCLLVLWSRLPALTCASDRGSRKLMSNPETHHGSQQASVIIHTPKDIYPRLNLQDLIHDSDLRPQLDLLLQAYLRLQERPVSSPVSYFQIAGIHGQPYQAWNGVHTHDPELSQQKEPFDGMKPGLHGSFAGYCWHASVLFPTWHRTYTLLMEQEVRSEAFKIAEEYSKSVRRKYLEAAERLRMPFWDWVSEDASNNGLPGLFLQKEVEVETPEGLQTVRNPLESYTFQGDVAVGNAGLSRGADTSEGQQIGFAPSLSGESTLRHPDLSLQARLDNLQEDLRSEISAFVHPAWNAMLHNPEVEQSWARFSTHKPRNDGLRPESNLLDLEGLHDHVHDVVGGIVFIGDHGYPGHFSDTNLAAYDPVFFMHHSNLDRMTALYQRRNPSSWIEETNERHVMNYMAGLHGHVSNSSTPLWPFRKSHNAFYTSDDVREFTTLGYTYPEFMDELKDPSPLQDSSGVLEPQVKPESSEKGWSLFNNSTHLGRMASIIRGGDGVGGEIHRPFHRSFWCPHSRFGWCHHSTSTLSNYTGDGD